MIWEFVIGPAVATFIGGPLIWLFRRFDRRNTEQHGENLDVLKSIEGKVDRLDTRLDDHFEWHMSKKDR